MSPAQRKALLPVITCDGCGACCMEQTSPPGYAYILSDPDLDFSDSPFCDDAERLARMPNKIKGELIRYLHRLRAGDFDGLPERPCIWLDPITKVCRHYEWRPDICRDLDVGSDGCLNWRREYSITAAGRAALEGK